MHLPRRLLADGEQVEMQVRTHAKSLLGPALLLILLGAAAGIGIGAIPAQFQPIGSYVVLIVAAVLLIWGCLVPFLRWRSTTYTVTDRRVITRSGILHKNGKNLELAWIADVGYRRSLMDRMLGCGSLYLQPAGDRRRIVLRDVPDVESVQRLLSDLLFAAHAANRPDTAGPRPENSWTAPGR